MRIAINALGMKRRLHGVGNYIKNLVWGLSKIDSENEYLIFGSSENACHLEGLGRNFHIEMAPNRPALRVIWEQTILPLKLKKERIDLYHGPAFAAPLIKTCAQVVSIHDMSFHLVPEQHSLHTRLYLRVIVPSMLKNSDGMIAVSEHTKSDILCIGGIEGQRVAVIPLGVEERFVPIRDEAQVAKVREKYKLPREFILFVGMIEPRKNLENLVDAYFKTSLSDRCDLVLAGSLGWGYSGLLQKIEATDNRGSIRLPGYVDDADLPTLYSAATVFAYPSQYEGFGLPVLEAMACEAPVITSSVSSLPEVAGDAAVMVDPDDVDALASNLRSLVEDRGLRERLSRHGRERAKRFTWSNAAQKTLAVYEQVSGLKPVRAAVGIGSLG